MDDLDLFEEKLKAMEYLQSLGSSMQTAPPPVAFLEAPIVRIPLRRKELVDPNLILPDDYNMVSSQMLLDSGQFQQRAKMIPWPSNFYMEIGKDRRKGVINKEDRDHRHQIDWYRPGSYVQAMPRIDQALRGRNPYEGAGGIAHGVAYATWESLVDKRRVSSDEITDEVVRIAPRDGRMRDNYKRTAVRDTLRDLALFGLAKRVRRGSKLLFEIL